MAISLILPPALEKRAYELFDEVGHAFYLGLAPSGGLSKILVSWLRPKALWTIGRPSWYSDVFIYGLYLTNRFNLLGCFKYSL